MSEVDWARRCRPLRKVPLVGGWHCVNNVHAVNENSPASKVSPVVRAGWLMRGLVKMVDRRSHRTNL